MHIPIRYNLRSLIRRKVRTGLTIFGMSLVIMVFVMMMAMSNGLYSSYRQTGNEDNIIVIQKGAFSQEFSSIKKNTINILKVMSNIGISKNGDELISPEIQVGSWVSTRKDGYGKKFIMTRGVKPIAFSIFDQVKMVAGGIPERNNKIIISRLMIEKLGGRIKLGDKLFLENTVWTINGIFDGGGTIFDQEIWVDLDDLAVASNHEEYSSYTIKAGNKKYIMTLIEDINNNKEFSLSAMKEKDYYNDASALFTTIYSIGLLIAILVTIASILSGMNTMYTAIYSRVRDIAILRTLGFRERDVMFSFITESLLISLISGILGIIMGVIFASMLSMDLPMLTFKFKADHNVILGGFLLSILVGLLGGYLPARKGAYADLVTTLKRR